MKNHQLCWNTGRIEINALTKMLKNVVLILTAFVGLGLIYPPKALERQQHHYNHEYKDEQQIQEITNRSIIPQTIDGKQYFLHAVLQGQTLYSIARAYGVDEETIIEENPDIRDGLRFDQIIRIPVTDDAEQPRIPSRVHLEEVAPAPDGDYIEHEVQRRETLFGLSQQYGISIEKLLFYNPEAREGLKVDQVLQIPLTLEDEAGQAYQTYTVSSGETKYSISRAFEMSVEELESLNPETKEGLRAGQQLRIPLDDKIPPGEPATASEGYIFLPPDFRTEDDPRVDTYCFDPDIREQYNVALLIPLYLEDLAPDDGSVQDGEPSPVRMPENNLLVDAEDRTTADSLPDIELPLDHKSFSFISYYHGVLLALDSIKKMGGNINLRVYDVCQDLAKATKLTDKDDLLDTDLIIGPFHRQTLDHIAAFGLAHDIPVVSPMLPDLEQLEGFPNLFKATPSLESMLKELAGYVSRHYPKQNILLVHDNQPGAIDIISAFHDTLLTEVAISNHFYDSLHLTRINGYYFDNTLVGNRRTNVLIMPESASNRWLPDGLDAEHERQTLPKPQNVREVIYRTEGFEGLVNQLQKDKNNVLITLIGGEPFLADYLRKLNEQRHFYNITVFGIPDWQTYANIEVDYLQNLKVHYFVPHFYDYSEPHIQDFVLRYREWFLAEPDQDAFIGGQTAWFFFNSLLEYGRDFQRCMPLLNQLGHESPFSFQKSFGDDNGWENRNTFVYRIQNYRVVDVMKPVEGVVTQKTE